MRTRAFLMAAAVLAASGGIAEAQVRPGQYGGGFIEYLFAGGASPGRRAAPQALRDDGTLPRHPAAYGYGGPGSPRPASATDPMARYRLEPGAAATRVAALPEQRYSNPYEDADPIAWAPEPGPARTSPAYRAAAPVARAPDPQFARQTVAFEGAQRAGTIVIDTRSRYLYLVQPGHSAIRYGIGVGRPGFLWQGVKTVSAKKEWPDWTPPKEMLARRPDLPTFMAGGVENPLGARALYLGSSLYRIHGTNEPHTIGQAVSSGCIRMMNEDVIDLYGRTPVGARVEVI